MNPMLPTNFGPVMPKAGAPQIFSPPPKSGGPIVREAAAAPTIDQSQDRHQEERQVRRAKRTMEPTESDKTSGPQTAQNPSDNVRSDMVNFLRQEMDRMRHEMVFSMYGANMFPQPGQPQQGFTSQAPQDNKKWAILVESISLKEM